jgi:phenylacetate-coenzyme A ligase PaaK-like adenylate-forming protein
MEDWITLSDGKQCDCGLHSPIFGKPVEGRVMSNIILPNGKVFPPSAFLFITSVLRDLNEFKIKRYQIIQKKLDEIEILLVIDDDLRDKGASFEEIAKKIKKVYLKETGPEVQIIVKEVKEIKDDPDSGKPAPLVVSNVNLDTVCKLKD